MSAISWAVLSYLAAGLVIIFIFDEATRLGGEGEHDHG